VQELDRILDRHDMGRARPVDVIDHSGERRALAAARRSRDQHEPALLVGDLLQHGGQAQFLDRRDLHRDDAQHEADGASLLEDVAPETAEPGHAVRKVDFLPLLELLSL
jgi:hypothetical protein